MNDLVLLGKALSDPTRIRILLVLQMDELEELCVCEIADALEMSQSTLSTHLQTIRQAGLVTTRKQAKWSYYGLEPAVIPLLETLLYHYSDALAADQRLKRDAQRIRQRLALRENGCCVIGIAQLEDRTKNNSEGKIKP